MKKMARAITLATGLLLTVSPTVSWASTTSSTTVVSNQWVQKSGHWYYINSAGQYTKGWKLINAKWYFFDGNGVMKTGWILDKGKWYFLNQSGAMKTGWLLDKGKWYHLSESGAMDAGWLKDKGKWYLLESSGAMLTGWRNMTYNYAKGWYYFNPSGDMATGWIKDGGKDYKLLPDGRWAHNVIADGYFYENNSLQSPGSEVIKDNVNVLKAILNTRQTKEEVANSLGSQYSVEPTGSYWEYSMVIPDNGNFEAVKSKFTLLSPIDLGNGKVSIKVLITWSEDNKLKGYSIAYFSTDQRLHLYQNAHNTESDVIWFGNLID
ncbi:hypothetical protein [Neobacillus sp. PS2-9]|uniref:hypothetical protein n=1 Tax=Neobacillus sp. PS2-9 TaxID=3070676 RepID=UPI0027E0B17B|nr:hypothetical protein [Neobacillus sp. PS2-9]WML58584.1 hypothetical protein RCG25_01980 [Neobacillus sp. PS2-9]